MDKTKLFYQIALTQINGVGDITARNLLQIIGDEEAIFKSSKKELTNIKGISSTLVNAILSPEVLRKAEKELNFVEKNKLQTFFINDEDYPARMKECVDAPILLYFKGNSNFNKSKVISLVGTRKSTSYGSNFCDLFLEKLSAVYPETLIISGLAYGIDIQSHKSALKHNLPTIGVLAHGLDRIYPSVHRKTAIEMLNNGGLLTEFPSETEPERHNFVRRNRIVAAMADAVIVVESDSKGGSLITADIANSYNKDVFAVPGRTTDIHSIGCNNLILDNKAIMLQSFESFVQQMNWENTDTSKMNKAKQRELFMDLTEEEQTIYDVLSKVDTIHVNLLAIEVERPVSQLFFTLLEMEMKNVIEPIPGGAYKLV